MVINSAPRVPRQRAWIRWLLLSFVLVLSGCQTGPTVHDDRHGPLSATSGHGGFAMTEPRNVKPPWYGSFGSYMLCSTEPGTRIELQGVSWKAAADAPPLAVETWLRSVDRVKKHAISVTGITGFPWEPYQGKPVRGDYSDHIAGTVINQDCADLDDKKFTELFFVIKTSKAGAHLKRAYVDYLADGEPYRLVINWEMITCGEAIERRPEPPDGSDCPPDRLDVPKRSKNAG